MSLFPLHVQGAVVRRRGKTLIGPVDLELEDGGTVAVIGPNGSGKTTLLTMLHGLTRLRAGTISWSCPVEEARTAQSFVFQTPVMLRRSVLENLTYPLEIRGVARAAARQKAQDWAARVDLQDMLERSALVLSGGERQKLALARALIVKPELLFLDEPSAALDGAATRKIEDVLHMAKQAGTRLIMSTHDMGQARRLADRVVFVLHGKIHETGPASAFFDAPQTAQAQAFLNGDIVE